MPKYSNIDETQFDIQYRHDIGELLIKVAEEIRVVKLYQSKLPDSNVIVIFIDCPYYFHRKAIYTNDNDEDERFILFCKGVLEAMRSEKWTPDIIHCNDWQTGLIPLYIKDNYKWDSLFCKNKNSFFHS